MCVVMVYMTHITQYLPIEIFVTVSLYRCCQFILKGIFIEFKYKILATNLMTENLFLF